MSTYQVLIEYEQGGWFGTVKTRHAAFKRFEKETARSQTVHAILRQYNKRNGDLIAVLKEYNRPAKTEQIA